MTHPSTIQTTNATSDMPVGRRSRSVWRSGVIGLMLLGALAGCAGTPRPGGYDCVNTLGGCFTLLALGSMHKDASGAPDLDGTTITGAASEIQVVPLSCDAACRASSGDTTRPGYIANYIQLWEQDNGAFIRLGYRTNDKGEEWYFDEYGIPGTSFTSQVLAPTHVDPGATSDFPAVQLNIGSVFGASLGDCGGTIPLCFTDSWTASVVLPGGGGSYDATTSFTTEGFKPNWLYYTQQIWGTSGATAGYATFERNQYGEKLVSFISGVPSGPDWHYLRHDGSPPAEHGTATHPSFGNWSFNPSADSTGGVYYLYCCAPL
jgi:hypothetical protein